MRRLVALLLALAAVLAACTFGKGSDRHGLRPTYQPVDCPAEIAAVLRTDHACGTLTVLAHHGNPDDGKLRLFVVRIQPGTGKPAPDPVLSLGGDLGVAPDYVTLGPRPQDWVASSSCWTSAGRAGPSRASAAQRSTPCPARPAGAGGRPANPKPAPPGRLGVP
jgi:hypothetical protein